MTSINDQVAGIQGMIQEYFRNEWDSLSEEAWTKMEHLVSWHTQQVQEKGKDEWKGWSVQKIWKKIMSTGLLNFQFNEILNNTKK